MARPLLNLRPGLWALCLCTGVAAGAAELSADEKLQAVRQELLQAALQGATQVRSTAWIDGSGALQESSSFRHGLQVRGVRVLSYHRDEAGQPAAKVQWQASQDLNRPATAAQPGAAAAAGGKPVLAESKAAAAAAAATATATATATACDSAAGLRHVLGWSLSMTSRAGIDEHHVLRETGEVLTQRWRERADSARRWRTLELPPPSAPQGSSYLRLLTAGPAEVRPSWVASVRLEHLQLQPLSPALILGQTADPVPAKLRLVFSLSQAEGGEPRLRDSQELTVFTALPAWGPMRLDVPSAEALRQQLDRWARQVDELLACQAPQVQVLHSQADRVQVDQGALAGLRPGQEWLISDRRKVPAQVLEPGAADAMVLARIERVDAQRAELRVLAGPRDQIRPRWQAWPMPGP